MIEKSSASWNLWGKNNNVNMEINYQIKMPLTNNVNLTNATFNNCDLIGSIFKTTILEKTDFRTSFNYSIDPEINRIKKAKFSLQGVIGLLGKYQIEIE